MRTIVKIILPMLFILASCNQNQSAMIQELQLENDSLKAQIMILENTLQVNIETQFATEKNYSAFMLLEYTRQYSEGTISHLRATSGVRNISSTFTEDEKYRMLDDFTNDVFINSQYIDYKIVNRELYIYKTYAEASKARAKYIELE